MNELQLLRQHADVLFERDAADRVVALNEPEGDLPPRLFLARGHTSQVLLFGRHVSMRTIQRCAAIAASLGPWSGSQSEPSVFEPLRVAVAAEAPIVAESIGPAFRFGSRHRARPVEPVLLIDSSQASLLGRHFPFTAAHLAWREPVIGAVVDGVVVSACYSARKRETASEAGVDTVEAFRGRGLAVAVVAGWREAVERGGAVPLYSTTWDNAASRAVASRLGLACYAETLSIT